MSCAFNCGFWYPPKWRIIIRVECFRWHYHNTINQWKGNAQMFPVHSSTIFWPTKNDYTNISFLKGNRDNHFPPFCRWITSVTPSSFAVPFRLGRNGRPMYIYQTLFDVRNVETPTATIDSSLIKMCGFTRYDKKSSAVFDRHLKWKQYLKPIN